MPKMCDVEGGAPYFFYRKVNCSSICTNCEQENIIAKKGANIMLLEYSFTRGMTDFLSVSAVVYYKLAYDVVHNHSLLETALNSF